MKKILNKTLLISIALITIISSCTKELDKNPPDQLNAATFYSSASAVSMALTACYGTLQNAIFTCNMPAYDCLADDGYEKLNLEDNTTLSQGPITSTSGGYVNDVYSYCYSSIATFNIFLQTLAAYSGSDLTAAQKTEYEAEVRLLRALRYFDLYKFYGSVPLITVPLTIKTQNQPKVGADSILAQINADIAFAVANLPNTPYASNSGHVVKASAEVLEARVLLFNGYNADGTAIPTAMTQAAAVTSDIINSGYYSIAPSFRGLFCADLGQQTGNPEFIFSVNYIASVNFPSPDFGWGIAEVYLQSTGADVWPLQNMANAFEFTDGTPFSTTNPLYDPTNVYKNRDPRMAKTMFTGTVTFENGFTTPPAIGALTTTGYNYYKQVNGTDAENEYANLSANDWPSMRYAEVLLMYAEAENEAVGPTAAVYSAINQIRNRADILMPPLPAGLSQSDMRTAIRSERRVELAFEGFRYDDLKRWQIAPTALTLTAAEAVRSKTFLPINYTMPLPETQIDISDGVLIQNSNY